MRTLCIEEFNQVYSLDSILKQNSKDIKDKIDKLKTSNFNKDNYILSKEDKNSFIDFNEQVNNTNKEYDKVQPLSNTLVNAHDQLRVKITRLKLLLRIMKHLI